MKQVGILRQYANGENDKDGSKLHVVELEDGKEFKLNPNNHEEGLSYFITGKDKKGNISEYQYIVKNKEVSEVFTK